MANKRTVCELFEKFLSSSLDPQNEPRTRPDSKVNNAELKVGVQKDASQTTCEIAGSIDVTITTI